MADNARKTHVSPGVYSREIDLNYAVKSLGITTLGLAGETLKGPAFEPIDIEDWARFQDMFGGTSTEKFKGTQYPKYELPYIAKSYLSESKQLKVCRVLGLSGYNAGPAWAITAKKGTDTKEVVVAVIRSRGYYNNYEKYEANEANCACGLSAHDKLHFYVGEFDQVAECKYVTHYNKDALVIAPYTNANFDGDECSQYGFTKGGSGYGVLTNDYGHFTLSGFTGIAHYSASTIPVGGDKVKFAYPVSLNPNDKDYILKVLGTDPHNGEAPIYVESLYDVAHVQGIYANEIDTISNKLTFYDVTYPADLATIAPVNDFVTKPEGSLTKKDLGKRFLYSSANSGLNAKDATCHIYSADTVGNVQPIFFVGMATSYDNKGKASGVTTHSVTPSIATADTCYESEGGKWTTTSMTYSVSDWEGKSMTEGVVYTVRKYTDANGKRHYYYTAVISNKSVTTATTLTIADYLGDALLSGKDLKSKESTEIEWSPAKDLKGNVTNKSILVKNMTDSGYYRLSGATQKVVTRITTDLNNYKSAYRFASTPWIVSNAKGDYDNLDVTRLFRFHTISDGNNANNEVKISIINILPDEGIFDVQVRRIDDTDAAPIVLESFSKVNLVPGDRNYIAYKIGSYDGVYESKSKYITVEVNETLVTANSSPAGFLGYPMARYDGVAAFDSAIKKGSSSSKINCPYIKYNRDYDIEIKNRKQYFGLSDLVGVDIDMFTYKGNVAYLNENDPEYPKSLTSCFHLDSRLDNESYIEKSNINVTVDGQSGFTFSTVAVSNVTDTLDEAPVFGTEDEMEGTIYEYVNLRKFTVYFYGGFDGWDEYRDARTTTDNFMYSRYKGKYSDVTGEGFAVDRIDNPDLLGLNQKGITTDWYAYLAAIRKFANPVETDINVFATPGIDYVNNQKLVEEVIEMIEEERADSIYVVTTPDKPSGAMDFVDEMYTPDEAVMNLESSEIDSNYTCTYYPWIKYEDIANHQYIYLPPTKDVVRNMAMTDNIAHPWFAPAGLERGNVECARAHVITKLADEDVLYEGRINPVKTFSTEGVKLWGQKNLQIRESQLNRIAVRRLLLRMRKLVAIACLSLIFEPNDASTKDKFLSIVTPILDNIRANRGISDYKIEVDDSLEARERRELPAKIFFKPYNALEYIPIDFILTPEGVSFDDI